MVSSVILALTPLMARTLPPILGKRGRLRHVRSLDCARRCLPLRASCHLGARHGRQCAAARPSTSRTLLPALIALLIPSDGSPDFHQFCCRWLPGYGDGTQLKAILSPFGVFRGGEL